MTAQIIPFPTRAIADVREDRFVAECRQTPALRTFSEARVRLMFQALERARASRRRG